MDLLQKIENGSFSRLQLIELRKNALRVFQNGDDSAKKIIDLIDSIGNRNSDRRLAFVGFCPGGDIKNRLDKTWIEAGICEFRYFESEHQHERFAEIMAGDTIVLKKREKFGETMKLYTHGIVEKIVEKGSKLKVKWQKDCAEIIVPLMGCNSTVDMKTVDTVNSAMPDEFWAWLEEPKK